VVELYTRRSDDIDVIVLTRRYVGGIHSVNIISRPNSKLNTTGNVQILIPRLFIDRVLHLLPNSTHNS